MKHIKSLFVLSVIVLFSSCLDTEEKIVLQGDNSGSYSLTFDLGRLLKIAASMGDNKDSSGKMKEKKDTTIFLKDVVMAEKDLTTVEKELYKNGKIQVTLDGEKNEAKIEVTNFFKNTHELTEIKNNLITVLGKLKALEKIFGKEAGEDNNNNGYDMAKGGKMLNPLAGRFTFIAATNSLSNQVSDINTFKDMAAKDSTLSMLSQFSPMMGDFNYRTVIVLPKPVKNYEGTPANVSADKKTLVFSTTLTEIIAHPEKAGYKIMY